MEILAYPILLILFTGIFTFEVIAPVSKNSCDKRWLLIASGLGMLQLIVSLSIGVIFKDWFYMHAIISLNEEVPAFIIGLLAFFITSFIFYWWHRAIHKSSFLWRYVHQLHHSPKRIESLTAFYAHPFDSGGATLISCLSAYFILGASAEAAAWAVFYTGLFNFYVHSDTRSPYWLGFIIQRPEMHRLHHKYNHHADNYGLPIWDFLFGTYVNPREIIVDFGFDENESERIFEMLKGVNVGETSKTQ